MTLRIYDILGREAATLLDEFGAAGVHSVVWNGADDEGRSLASGMYYYRLQTDTGVETRRLMMVK